MKIEVYMNWKARKSKPSMICNIKWALALAQLYSLKIPEVSEMLPTKNPQIYTQENPRKIKSMLHIKWGLACYI